MDSDPRERLGEIKSRLAELRQEREILKAEREQLRAALGREPRQREPREAGEGD
jgi:regulator of replication initiation timing